MLACRRCDAFIEYAKYCFFFLFLAVHLGSVKSRLVVASVGHGGDVLLSPVYRQVLNIPISTYPLGHTHWDIPIGTYPLSILLNEHTVERTQHVIERTVEPAIKRTIEHTIEHAIEYILLNVLLSILLTRLLDIPINSTYRLVYYQACYQ